MPSTVVRISEQGEQIVSVAVPDPALPRRARRADAVDAGRRHRQDRRRRAQGDPARLRRGGAGHRASCRCCSPRPSPIRCAGWPPPRFGCAAASRAARRSRISPIARTRSAICRSALRDMTNALYARIEAIESFAADVTHELKNPLTSLRSAVETLPLAKNESSRSRLMEVIQHDVRRLDRLITDISDASRLDAELAREDAAKRRPEEVHRRPGLRCRATPDAAQEEGRDRLQGRQSCRRAPRATSCLGHDLRLGQVITNLIENARSFVPEETGRISDQPVARRQVRSSLPSTTTARASAPTTSTASSSASIPTGRPARRSARIPASACRSAGRSSRRMAAR